MEIKYLIVLTVVGVAAGFTLPSSEQNSDLESSFSSGGIDASGTRDKRHLLKKWKKGGSNTVVVNRQYEQGSSYVGHGPSRREIHHHHHYSYPPPPREQYVERHYVESQSAPNHEYHHYHGGYAAGGYASHGSTYYNGGYSAGGSYYSKPAYGPVEGSYGGSYGGYAPPPPSGPVVATPIAAGHNSVDRGQGAAAVNNIAIIHARAGSSSSQALEESKLLPRPLPVDIDALSSEAFGH